MPAVSEGEMSGQQARGCGCTTATFARVLLCVGTHARHDPNEMGAMKCILPFQIPRHACKNILTSLSLAKIIFAIKLCLSEWFDYILFQKPPQWLSRGSDIITKHNTLNRHSVSEPTRWPMNSYLSGLNIGRGARNGPFVEIRGAHARSISCAWVREYLVPNNPPSCISRL